MFFKDFMLYFYVTGFCVNFSFSSPTNNLKLELIQVLFRHGARAPIECEAKLLSKISNETSYAPWGYAQLTSQGMMQEYKIGQMLRERYNDFIPSSYDINHVYPYASGVRRTKASLELVLAALYPPTGKLVWNPDLNWMPIVIHSNPRPMDILIKPRDCPKYKEVIQELINSSEIKTEVAKYDKIRRKMEEIYGEAFNFDRIFCAYNAIVVHKNMNLSLPDWYNEDIFIKLREATEFYLEILSYTQTLKRLNGGTLVRKFVENLKNSNKRKLYLYSAHDKTLHAFLRSHNITDTKSPDYGSTIILEKLRDKNDKIYVKLLLWTGEPKKLITLSLKNCEEVCPLNKYLEIVSAVLPSDDEMLCLFKNLQPKDIRKILATDTTNIED